MPIRFDLGKETLFPDFKGAYRSFNPNIDYIDGVPYLGFWIPTKIRTDKKSGDFDIKYQPRLFIISGTLGTIIPHDAKELEKNDLFIKENIMPTPLRWDPAYIDRYVNRPYTLDDESLKKELAEVDGQLFSSLDVKVYTHYFDEYLEYTDPSLLFYLLQDTISSHIEFQNETYSKITSLWSMLTYFIRLSCFDCSPYLSIGGAKRVGKTKLQILFSYICFNAILSASITASSVFRIVENNNATILMDETEKLFKKNENPEYRNVLLGGFMRGAGVFRTEESSSKKRKPTKYDIYGCKCVSCIAGLEDVLNDRVVANIILVRSTDKKILDSWPRENDLIWSSLRNKLYLLYLKHATEVMDLEGQARVRLQEAGISSRPQLLWKPIIMMALLVEKYGTPGLVDEILDLSKKIEVTRRAQDEIENPDVRIVRILHTYCKEAGWFALKEIRKRFGEEVGEEKERQDGTTYIEIPKWVTPRFIGSILRRLQFNETRLVNGATQFFIDPVKVDALVESMGVTKNAEKNKDDRGLLIDRVIDNSLLRKACAICGEQPDKLFPDKNEEYYICKECKLREGK